MSGTLEENNERAREWRDHIGNLKRLMVSMEGALKDMESTKCQLDGFIAEKAQEIKRIETAIESQSKDYNAFLVANNLNAK